MQPGGNTKEIYNENSDYDLPKYINVQFNNCLPFLHHVGLAGFCFLGTVNNQRATLGGMRARLSFPSQNTSLVEVNCIMNRPVVPISDFLLLARMIIHTLLSIYFSKVIPTEVDLTKNSSLLKRAVLRKVIFLKEPKSSGD